MQAQGQEQGQAQEQETSKSVKIHTMSQKNNQHQCQILEVWVETTSVVDTHEPDLARPLLVASISLSELERQLDFSGVCRLKTEGRQGIQ